MRRLNNPQPHQYLSPPLELDLRPITIRTIRAVGDLAATGIEGTTIVRVVTLVDDRDGVIGRIAHVHHHSQFC